MIQQKSSLFINGLKGPLTALSFCTPQGRPVELCASKEDVNIGEFTNYSNLCPFIKLS